MNFGHCNHKCDDCSAQRLSILPVHRRNALCSSRVNIQHNSENKPRGLYFAKALFEGLIFGGAFIPRGLSTEGNLRFKIDWASLIVERKFTVFALFYFVFEGNFSFILRP